MEKIAIIGSGISGMGCAHFLHRQFDITIFEKNNYIGGHTNTVYVNENEKNIPIDTGFIVCNFENYPDLMQLFKEIKVPLKKTNMSFSAQIIHEQIEYCGSSLKLLFAQKKNIFSFRYIRFLLHLKRFNKQCLEVLSDYSLQHLDIESYCKKIKIHQDVLNWYLLPMSSALWSAPPDTSSKFPVLALVRFFMNHGFLGLNTQFQWYTVEGGSEEYKKKIIEPFKQKIKIEEQVKEVKIDSEKVTLITNKNTYTFDKVIFACHADQAIEIFPSMAIGHRNILAAFKYERNIATLHTDKSLMPKLKKVWSSWNYRIEKEDNVMKSGCTYWMNHLQGVSDSQDYFLSINGQEKIDTQKILFQTEYEHPIFTVEAMQNQININQLNQQDQVFYCGSYFRYGFHEDAFMSAKNVAQKILKK